ncbi:hypothetical protein QBC44DRAFT_46499 [Cladorrhinum sp. PSN332]|nr:hypothetical protein QBC44DRAFT_46499 [Cladorrhinum sp. PSN332]
MLSSLTSSTIVIKKDVCIIGGGAAGTYAALRLRDAGKTVAIVERSRKLGGSNRATPSPTLLRDSEVTRKYYDRFKIGLETKKLTSLSDKAKTFQVIDFDKGMPIPPEKYDVDGLPLPTKLRESFKGSIAPEALQFWEEQLPQFNTSTEPVDVPKRAKGEPKVKPKPAMGDQPFGIIQGGYRNAIGTIANNFCKGYGDIYKLPLVNLARNFGPSTLRGLKDGFLMPEDINNDKLYHLAQQELKDDVLFNCTPVKAITQENRISITVRDQAAPFQVPSEVTIQADKCLITIPPFEGSLDFLDLSKYQNRILSGFRYAGYWTMTVRNTYLREDIHFMGGTCFGAKEHALSRKAKSHRPWQAIYDIKPTGVPGAFQLEFGFDGTLNVDAQRTKQYIEDALRRLWTNSSTLFLPGTKVEDIQPVFDHARLHHPYGARVDKRANVSYDYKFNNMMHKHIFSDNHLVFGGAAFCGSQDASLIWEETEKLVRDRLL